MSDSRLRVVSATRLHDVEPYLDAWRDLHARRLEDNVFLRPGFLLPLLEHASAEEPWTMTFVLESGGRMVGCAIFAVATTLAGTPIRVLSTWEHEMFLEATPMLDRERADEAAAGLVRWLDRRRNPWSAVRWSRVGLETRAWAAITAAAAARGRRWWLRRAYPRAVLRPRADFDAFLADVPSKRRGRLRWRRNRLDKEGRVEVRVFRDLRCDPTIVDRLLQLEAAGWKGKAGTALACDPRNEAFFRAACDRLAADRALYFVELLLEGRPVSINANFLDGGTLYGFKSGWDPELDSLSPGMMNALETVRLLHEDPELTKLDSAAEADSHLDGVWLESESIGEVLVATGGFAGWTISLLPYVRRSRDLAQRAVDAVLRKGAA